MTADFSTPTIFALASAPGRAGIAVLRLSGTRVHRTLLALIGKAPIPRRATRAQFRDPDSGEPIDDGVALYFPAPHSYTGEDVVELHVHGSRAVVAALLDLLGRRDGLRLAEPGEFTRRAFENGKLDLTEAEAVADLVAAETAAQRRQALRQLVGALGALYEEWRARLMRALARLEAEIDFPEEGLPPDLWAGIRAEVAALAAAIAAHLEDRHRGERLRDGVSVAILGPPNAGKSSLMNALAKRDIAITSAIAGTTRDIIEARLDLGGYPVLLADTAGLRPSADTIEQEGVRRALARAETADLRLVILDATRPDETLAPHLIDENALVVVNKIDRAPNAAIPAAALRLSVVTGEGMPELLSRLAAEVAKRAGNEGAPLITRARHREALQHCAAALARFPDATLPELAAEDLRQAARALGRITGRVDVEDMLDLVFREFCIGK
ncbi:MAG TPA: tRNA uridine-5-carboxymethylaminomethyl(34) synthesis GTPase MnmE [Stellaceae bacterium]|nr:tRNA uridine-5-carboxymethylaminomethyl(34) synthesis GTPase MnmE [Stellaceae bacterium]